MSNELKTLELNSLHEAWGGRMVPFAGYSMAVQYKDGIIKEHNQVRNAAGFFDISHMGQCFLSANDFATSAKAIESHVAADIQELNNGAMRYSQLLNDTGGILDDLMMSRFDEFSLDGANKLSGLYVVVNAACKDQDFDFLQKNISTAKTDILDRCLFAVQGPKAEAVLQSVVPEACKLDFMHVGIFAYDGKDLIISRSGYTGEDGFEISVSFEQAQKLASALVAHADCEPIGLGARDSLRLEAGLCLYGHDIDTKTSPVEAALTWSVGKRRRVDGGFSGSDRIIKEIAEKPSRRRIGLMIEGKAPAREGCEIQDTNGNSIGIVTSGGFSPSLSAPIAMGYVEIGSAAADTIVHIIVRDKPIPAKICKFPFVQKQYKKT